MLGLDRLALVADAPLALLELDLELGQLRLALVERRRPVRELLLGADVHVVGLGALLQLLAQLGLTPLRRLELGAEGLHVRTDDGLERVAVRRARSQLEAELDVRRPLRLGLCLVTIPPALQLGAQPGTEPLFGLGPLVL